MNIHETARLCHSVAVRMRSGAEPERLRQKLSRIAADLPVVGSTLWVEHVAGPADSNIAAVWRDRELRRGVNPRLGPGTRTGLLQYTDGAADLIVVGHRSVISNLGPLVSALIGGQSAMASLAGADLDELREALAQIDRAAAPDWGLASRRPAAGHGTYAFELPARAADGHSLDITLVGALGLVLSRYTGQEVVSVGGPEWLRPLALRVDAGTSVAAYLEGARRALAEPADHREPPLVGLHVTRTTPDIVESRQFLAPVHPLSIHVADGGGPELRVTCWYARDSFAPQIVEQFAAYLLVAHGNLVSAAPDTLLREVDVVDARERRRLAELGGLGRTPSGEPECIHHVVAARAAETPAAIAVCHEQQRLTYRELDQRANQVANALRDAGVAPGSRVGVCLERSLDLVVVLLGILKAGSAYVPMDPTYPADRLAFTVEDAELKVVVTSHAEFPMLPGVPLLAPECLTHPQATPEAFVDASTPDDAAYVIYTSGSTGHPKGVVVPHRNVASLLAATRDDFQLHRGDVWTLFHSSSFDFSVWEIWGCLMTGGRLVVVPYWVSRSPADFVGLLAAEQVTVLNQTPGAFSQLMEAERTLRVPKSVRLVIFGGEPLDAAPLRSWFDAHPEWECRLVNMFGITETTVHVTAQTVTRREALASSRSVGRPLQGWHVYVMDAHGRPVPAGVSGEIYVGGAGVARHYLNRPELTAQRFVADPFAPGLMYRSGDRGRLLPDGRLEHLGRLDNQVKLRGHRIELDEIRARLLEAPGVGAAAVILRQRGGDTASARLDAYVVFRGGRGEPGDVRRHAAQFLPEYMLPATVTALPALPLTPNGKTDAARLPEPVAAPEHAVALTDDSLEGLVRSAWQRVFGFAVRPDDNFFALGGNSLLAVRVSAELRSAGLPPIALRELYLNPTIRQLADVLSSGGALHRMAA